VLVAQMKKVGVEFFIENVPSSVLFGSWANDADRKKGRYDILMYTTGPGIDPHQHYEGYFHSKNIPTTANGGSGYNYTRHRDAQLDQYLEMAGKAPSMELRAEAYRKAQVRVSEIVPHIYVIFFLQNAHRYKWVKTGTKVDGEYSQRFFNYEKCYDAQIKDNKKYNDIKDFCNSIQDNVIWRKK